jgi:pre-rRNA-processing protein IPI3
MEGLLIQFEQEQVLQRLIPPVRLTTLSVSHTGTYVAGGTADGRIFFWEVSLPATC